MEAMWFPWWIVMALPGVRLRVNAVVAARNLGRLFCVKSCQMTDGKQGDMAAIEVVDRTAAFRSAAVTRKGQRARVCSMGPADGLRQTSTQLGPGTVRNEQTSMPPTLRYEKRRDCTVAKCHHR